MLTIVKEEYCKTYERVLQNKFEINSPVFKDKNLKDYIITEPPMGKVNLDKYFNVNEWLKLPLGYMLSLIMFMEDYDKFLKEEENILTKYFLPLLFNPNESIINIRIDIEMLCKDYIIKGVMKDMELINNSEHIEERENFILENKDRIPKEFYIIN